MFKTTNLLSVYGKFGGKRDFVGSADDIEWLYMHLQKPTGRPREFAKLEVRTVSNGPVIQSVSYDEIKMEIGKIGHRSET